MSIAHKPFVAKLLQDIGSDMLKQYGFNVKDNDIQFPSGVSFSEAETQKKGGQIKTWTGYLKYNDIEILELSHTIHEKNPPRIIMSMTVNNPISAHRFEDKTLGTIYILKHIATNQDLCATTSWPTLSNWLNDEPNRKFALWFDPNPSKYLKRSGAKCDFPKSYNKSEPTPHLDEPMHEPMDTPQQEMIQITQPNKQEMPTNELMFVRLVMLYI